MDLVDIGSFFPFFNDKAHGKTLSPSFIVNVAHGPCFCSPGYRFFNYDTADAICLECSPTFILKTFSYLVSETRIS